MTPVHCVGCSKPGESVCMSCIGVLRMRCKALAWCIDQLEIEVTRQSQHGSPLREGGKSTETPLIFDDRSSEALWVIRSTIHAWATEPGLGTTKGRAVWLSDNVFRFAPTGELDQLYLEILEACIVAWAVIDRPVRIYLGDCPTCRTVQIFGDPEKESHTCKQCRLVISTAELRADTRVRARAMWLTAAEAQRTLGEVYGVMVTRNRITQWHKRDRLPQVAGRYLVADILELAEGRNTMS